MLALPLPLAPSRLLPLPLAAMRPLWAFGAGRLGAGALRHRGPKPAVGHLAELGLVDGGGLGDPDCGHLQLLPRPDLPLLTNGVAGVGLAEGAAPGLGARQSRQQRQGLLQYDHACTGGPGQARGDALPCTWRIMSARTS
jgi:hypothetical protein